MATHILYNKTTGEIRHAMPGDHGPALLASLLASMPDKGDYAEAEVDEAAVTALEDATLDGRILWRRLKYSGGQISLLPDAAAEVTAAKARKAAKKAAKSDAKMTQLAGMTKADFMDLSANQKWDMVFTFMKAHLEE